MTPPRHSPRWRRATLLLLPAWLLGTSYPSPRAADEPPAPRPESRSLLPGEPLERLLGSQEAHVYSVRRGPGPRLVRVEQRGVDVAVATRLPGGESDLICDSPNGRWGPELALLPAGDGASDVEVRPSVAGAPPGPYRIEVEELEPGSLRAQGWTALARAARLLVGLPATGEEAGAACREALAAARAGGDRRLEAEALQTLGAVDHAGGDLAAAVSSYSQALQLWRELGEASRQAALLQALGRLQLDAGEGGSARSSLESAAEGWRRLDRRLDEIEARGDLCMVEQSSGSLSKAAACYQEVLAGLRDLGDTSHEDRLLNNLGGLYDTLGEPDAALEAYGRALDLRRRLGDRMGEAQALNNLAALHRAQGEWQEALGLYDQARSLVAALGERRLEAALLNNLGFAYASAGEPERALSHYQQALDLNRKMGDRRRELVALNNLGLTLRRLGQAQEARELHQQALDLSLALGDARQQAITRLRLAEVELEGEAPEAALGWLRQALPQLVEAGNRRGQANARHLEGRALTRLGRPQEAVAPLEEALALRRAFLDRPGEVETLTALAEAGRWLGQTDSSLAHVEAAAARVEEMQAGFVSPELRAAFLAAQRKAYELWIDLLMDRHAAYPEAGWDRRAFEVSERSRARTLYDALLQGGEGGADSAALSPLVERRRVLRRRLSARVSRQLGQVGADAEAAGHEIEALLVELDGVEGELRRRDARYASFSRPPALGPEQIADLLGPDVLLLEYALGERRSFLWAVGKGGLRTFVLPPSAQLGAEARRAFDELRRVEAGATAGPAATALLAEALLGPVWRDLGADVRGLVVVADGALQPVPFAALPVPSPGGAFEPSAARLPLVEHLEVVAAPSAAVLAQVRNRLLGRPLAPRQVAVLADPSYPPGGTFEPLPATRREAEAIATLAAAGQAWVSLGAEANREAVLSGRLRDYRVLHFASHGLADPSHPERSGLVLSMVDATGRPQDGFLGLRELYGLDLGADLVVLSGCQTAFGRELGGEGLMGLTRAFLYAGVPRVVASLWRVEDKATAELMTRFYRGLWQDGLSPAAALREAQRSLRREPRWRHPSSWAGFVLQGEWR